MDTDTIERLWKLTNVKDSHWLLRVGVGEDNARVMINLKRYIVSRLSLCIYLKLDYNDKSWTANHIDSLCRHKNCWNPLHVYKGTSKENRQDSIKVYGYKSHCPSGHLITGLRSNGTRYCKECGRIREANRKVFY